MQHVKLSQLPIAARLCSTSTCTFCSQRHSVLLYTLGDSRHQSIMTQVLRHTFSLRFRRDQARVAPRGGGGGLAPPLAPRAPRLRSGGRGGGGAVASDEEEAAGRADAVPELQLAPRR